MGTSEAFGRRGHEPPGRDRGSGASAGTATVTRGLALGARLGGQLLDLDLGAADLVAHRRRVLFGPLLERDLLDHARLLADLGLLGGLGHLDGALLEGRLGLLGAELAVDPLALGLDVLLAQADLLLDRPLDDVAADPHPAAHDLALADLELLLDHRHGLLPGLAASPLLLAGRLVAVHDRGGAVELLRGSLRGDQRLAAPDRVLEGAHVLLAEAPARDLGPGLVRVALAEAPARDLGPGLVRVALDDRDVPALKAGLEQLVHDLAHDVGVEDASDGGRHHSFPSVWLSVGTPRFSPARRPRSRRRRGARRRPPRAGA